MHDRKSFNCGVEALDSYLQQYAWQNQKSGVAKTIVAVPEERRTQILGYYALAPTSIDFEQVPKDLSRRLPRYPIPAYILARSDANELLLMLPLTSIEAALRAANVG